MNINQQADIEELFRRINKSISKNSKVKVGDEDLNKVRAYVVQSKIPHIGYYLLPRLAAPASCALVAARARRERDRRKIQQPEGANHLRCTEARN
jgi:hypothetical protein